MLLGACSCHTQGVNHLDVGSVVWLTCACVPSWQVMMKDADDVPGLVSSKAGLKYAGACACLIADSRVCYSILRVECLALCQLPGGLCDCACHLRWAQQPVLCLGPWPICMSHGHV